MGPQTRRSFLLGLVASGVLAACSDDPSSVISDSTGGSNGLVPVESSFERIGADGSHAVAATADRELASRLLGLIAEREPGNFIFSPYSIATAFSMAEAGAENESERQMREALRITIEDDKWHAARNSLAMAVTNPTTQEGATPLELEIVNTPFGQDGFAFVDNFLQVLAENYGAQYVGVDFETNPEGARELINEWVADATRDRIIDLLPLGSITDLTRLVLLNTVFFKAGWVNEFQPGQTEPATFRLLDGDTSMPDMMSGGARITYLEDDQWQAVRLPYWGGFSMTVVLPADGSFDEVGEQLAAGLWDTIRPQQTDYSVTLKFPKFSFATPTDLIPVFKDLGMVEPFDDQLADFTGLTTEAQVYISGAFHQATIEVDEFGTTATAATAVVVSLESAPEPVTFTADRPFYFVIEHDASGEPLFMGQVTDPTA